MASCNPKVSIVVPVYNVETYLGSCLDSLINQDVEDYEIICINDGSLDGSKEIVEDYQKRYPFITLINQKNQGLSVARNVGMQHIKGEYFIFVDSDDFLEPNTLGNLYNTAKCNDLDILDFRVKSYRDGATAIWRGEYLDLDKPIGGKDYFSLFVEKFRQQPSISAWSHLYRTSFIYENRLQFIPGRYYEDVPFTAEAYLMAKRVYFTDLVVYYYRVNESSITGSRVTRKHIEDLALISRVISELSIKYKMIIPMDAFFTALIKQVGNSFSNGTWKENRSSFDTKIFKKVEFKLFKKKNQIIYNITSFSYSFFVVYSILLILLKRKIRFSIS